MTESMLFEVILRCRGVRSVVMLRLWLFFSFSLCFPL